MPDLQPSPHRFAPAQACELARDAWAIEGARVVDALPGERDQNFLIAGATGRYVLKIAWPGDSRELVDAQDEALARVAATTRSFAVPAPVPSAAGRTIEAIAGPDGEERLVRVLRYVPGEPLAGADKDALASELGAALGALTAALVGFRHPGAVRELQWDLRRADAVLEAHRSAIADPARRALLERRLAGVEPALRALPGLRSSVAHNDANDYNVLVDDGRVSALLDFGDLVETATVAEPAVGLAYAMLGARDPVGVARRLAAAFHDRFPLEPAEAELLLPLALARLCVSVTLSAHQRALDPTNAYLSISERDAWALLDRFDAIPLEDAAARVAAACRPVRGAPRPTAELLERRRRLIGPSLSLSYRQPLHIVRGAGSYLYDADGSEYLDGVNNVCHVGHEHPRVVEAVARQMAVLNTNTRYLHEHLLDYAERLTATLPEPLEACYLVCSGSEANELALRMARTVTGRHDVVVLDAAYHGNTSALVGLSPYKFAGAGGSGPGAGVRVAPLPDPYRGPHRGPETGSAYAEDVRAVLAEAPAAAFFAESLPGCGGQILPPRHFLSAAFEHARAAGALAIADEVQCGLARVGSRFWGFELDGALPDIVTMGKPLGNGHPLAAVVTTRAIAEAFDNGMEYFNTFGGNPVSCAAGLAVLDVIRDEALDARALAVGTRLQASLRALADRHEVVGDVRGAGLYLGVELVRDRDAREPAPELASSAVDRARDAGVLLSTDGPDHNVVKIKPPLSFGHPEADRLVETLDRALAA
jgi:4-aminobutyrate aminotransferase-like enzyme/Ser/Thr protein kinase RdoA (MazF antagonist)